MTTLETSTKAGLANPARSHHDSIRGLWREPWASQVAAEADAIEASLHRAMGARPTDTHVPKDALEADIKHMLGCARDGTRRDRRSRRMSDRWNGTSVERAYSYLHAAKVLLIDLLPDWEIEAMIPEVAAQTSAHFPPSDIRRVRLDVLCTDKASIRQKRAGLKRALQLNYEVTDEQHRRVRQFRNVLCLVAIMIAVFMGALVTIVALNPAGMPLCFSPETGSKGLGGETQTKTVCPSGETTSPSHSDVLIVAGLGLIGGALAAAFAVRHIRVSATPYDIPLGLALLKLPTGALTAVAGILLLGGGFVPGLSELDSQRQILAYALVFGYAQQLATQLIDKRARGLVDELSTKYVSPGEPMQAIPLNAWTAEVGG